MLPRPGLPLSDHKVPRTHDIRDKEAGIVDRRAVVARITDARVEDT